jgi:hypothetical protein
MAHATTAADRAADGRSAQAQHRPMTDRPNVPSIPLPGGGIVTIGGVVVL